MEKDYKKNKKNIIATNHLKEKLIINLNDKIDRNIQLNPDDIEILKILLNQKKD